MYIIAFIALILIFFGTHLFIYRKPGQNSGNPFKLNKKINTRSKRFTLVVFGLFTFFIISIFIDGSVAGSVTQPDPTLDGNLNWQRVDMGFSIDEQKCLAIGSGRGDGIVRVYSTTNQVNEYTFLNNSWEKITFGDDFLTNSGIAIGAVRDDGKNRVYITKYSVHEYDYNSKWQGGEVRSTSIIDEDGIAIGNVRNDGINRIYLCDRYGIKELSYNNGDWGLKEIDNHPYAKLTVTDGRNDGVLRLYASINDHVYEFSWSGGNWQVQDCGGFNIYNSLTAICAGEGRNDGKNRIYVSGDSKDSNGGSIYELSYDGKNWQQNIVSESVKVDHLIVGKGKSDGINHLYTGSSKGIGEYTYSESWVKTSNIEDNLKINGLAVGDGRNDKVNRVYATGDDKHIYEYSFIGKAEVSPTETPTITPIETPTITPTETTQQNSPTGNSEKLLNYKDKSTASVILVLVLLLFASICSLLVSHFLFKKK